MAMRRFPALDGLRAIAALMVVFYHYAGEKWDWLEGWIGVDIFFVLSGFLITTLALREEDKTGRVSLRKFYVRRIFRILPVYFVVLGCVVALAWARREYFQVGLDRALRYYTTFTNEYTTAWGAPFGQSWTLGIEQKFYLVWPPVAFTFVALVVRSRSATVKTVARLAVSAALIVAAVEYVPGGYGANYGAIVLGGALAFVLHHRIGYRLLQPLTTPVAGVVLAAAFIALHLSIPVDAKFPGARPGFTLLYAGAVALLLPSLIAPGPGRWLLSRPVMTFIGERSYSVYLVQGIAALAVGAIVPVLAIPRTASAIVVCLVALFMAHLLYRYVEIPMIGRGRWIISLWDKPDRPAQEVKPPSPAVSVPVSPGRS